MIRELLNGILGSSSCSIERWRVMRSYERWLELLLEGHLWLQTSQAVDAVPLDRYAPNDKDHASLGYLEHTCTPKETLSLNWNAVNLVATSQVTSLGNPTTVASSPCALRNIFGESSPVSDRHSQFLTCWHFMTTLATLTLKEKDEIRLVRRLLEVASTFSFNFFQEKTTLCSSDKRA